MEKPYALTNQQWRRLLPVFALGLGIWLIILLGFYWMQKSTAQNLASIPINPAIEQRWGVRVTLIGVTADSGMVDFRYTVIDSDKALNMIQDVNNLPVLIAEDSGTRINSTLFMASKHEVRAGQTYFLLYRNANGAIKHGTPVSVVFGDLRLEHFIAQ